MIKSRISDIFYDFLKGIDALTLVLFILKAPDTLELESILDYFRTHDPDTITHISLSDARMMLDLIINILNNTMDEINNPD